MKQMKQAVKQAVNRRSRAAYQPRTGQAKRGSAVDQSEGWQLRPRGHSPGAVLGDSVNLSRIARELEVLKPWERFEED